LNSFSLFRPDYFLAHSNAPQRKSRNTKIDPIPSASSALRPDLRRFQEK
jgi:hypothetical protein